MVRPNYTSQYISQIYITFAIYFLTHIQGEEGLQKMAKVEILSQSLDPSSPKGMCFLLFLCTLHIIKWILQQIF